MIPRQLSVDLALPSGGICQLSEPEVPFLEDYFVLWVPEEAGQPSVRDLEKFSVLAQRVAQELAWLRFGDRECYSLIYNAARTRRKSWPHFHILIADSFHRKRRAFVLLQCKHLLRWFQRRWA